MLPKLLTFLLPAVLTIVGGAAPLNAGETGIAAIHAWHTVGRKTCIKDHWHYGNSSPRATKKEAEAEAIKGWEDFTGWDYGTDWMSYKLAESRASKCERVGTSGGAWTCQVEARACKLNKVSARASPAKK